MRGTVLCMEGGVRGFSPRQSWERSRARLQGEERRERERGEERKGERMINREKAEDEEEKQEDGGPMREGGGIFLLCFDMSQQSWAFVSTAAAMDLARSAGYSRSRLSLLLVLSYPALPCPTSPPLFILFPRHFVSLDLSCLVLPV
eukprot:768214-Hanusia_phi.AAC.2